jgi:hypothetical protein
VQAAAAQAGRIAPAVLPAEERETLIAAAWLHDIGYAPALAKTGFHPLDGARHLEALGVDRRLCCLVAHHSGATFEAEERWPGWSQRSRYALRWPWTWPGMRPPSGTQGRIRVMDASYAAARTAVSFLRSSRTTVSKRRPCWARVAMWHHWFSVTTTSQ